MKPADQYKKMCLWAALLLSVIAAPMLRIDRSYDPPPPDDLLLSKEQLKRSELIHLGQLQAANQGPYLIHGFRHKNCEGSIALLPMYRNAEGSHILERLLKTDNLRYGFIIEGQIYTQFPQIPFAIQKIKQGYSRVLNQQPQLPVNLFAFAEDGQCNLANTIAEITI